MFNWIKKLFKKEEKRVDLLILCQSIQQAKPTKRKRDKKGRFTK